MAGVAMVFAELQAEKLRDSAFEGVGLARRLAAEAGYETASVVLAASARKPAEALAAKGGGKVHAVEHALLARYSPDGFLKALRKVAEAAKPDLWIFPHSPLGWDLAPRLATAFGSACATEVFRVEASGAGLLYTKKNFGGKFDLKLRLRAKPEVVTLQAGSQPAYEGPEKGEVVPLPVDLQPADIRVRVVEEKQAPPSGVDLTAADVIVAAGRALGNQDKLPVVQELAKLLGGQVGASRPVTDAGWLPAAHQIGSSGVRVKPKLYVAAGISGAIQHVVGMKDSGYIVAINKDPEAPIFQVAHVGIVGDMFEVLPAIAKAVQELKG